MLRVARRAPPCWAWRRWSSVCRVAAAFVRERPVHGAQCRAARATGATVGEGLRSRGFWMLVVVLFFASIAQNGAIAHLSALLTDRGVSAGGRAPSRCRPWAAPACGPPVTGLAARSVSSPARVSFVLLAMAARGHVPARRRAVAADGRRWRAALIGFGMGGEADVTPYMLSRYFGLRAFSTLYGLTWTAYACRGRHRPVLMGKAFDTTGSYEALLIAAGRSGMLAVATLMLLAPRYRAPEPQE